jgi:hypothetical protein
VLFNYFNDKEENDIFIKIMNKIDFGDIDLKTYYKDCLEILYSKSLLKRKDYLINKIASNKDADQQRLLLIELKNLTKLINETKEA